MHSNVGKSAVDPDVQRQSWEVHYAISGGETFQQGPHFLALPGIITKLENVTDTIGQHAPGNSSSRVEVQMPIRGKLVEDRAALGVQPVGILEDPAAKDPPGSLSFFMWVRNLLALTAKVKLGRGFIAPFFEGAFPGESYRTSC